MEAVRRKRDCVPHVQGAATRRLRLHLEICQRSLVLYSYIKVGRVDLENQINRRLRIRISLQRTWAATRPDRLSESDPEKAGYVTSRADSVCQGWKLY